MSPLPTGAQPDDLRNQLYRYAQDLHELIDQHGNLQARYQSVLQSQGRASNNDLLLVGLREGDTPCLTTDSAGLITHVNTGAEQLLGETDANFQGTSITELAPHGQRPSMQALLAHLASPQCDGAAELHQMNWFDSVEIDSIRCFEVLLVPFQRFCHQEVFWLLQPHQPAAMSEVARLQTFALLHNSTHGLLLMDAQRTICAANAAATQITGYGAHELLGNTPHLLSSERHDGAFYQSFWTELLSRGSWSGELFNRRKSGQIYPEWKTAKLVKNPQGQTVAYMAAFADSAQHDSSTEQLSRLAYHDALTGLPNRRLLDDRLAQAFNQAQRDGTGMSVLFIDLDRFKPINDQLGHEVGDLLLQEIAKRLKKSVRQGDTAARVGGDEFVILLQSAVRREDVVNIINKVLSRLSQPITAGAHQLLVGASIGCARYPQDSTDVATLLKHADSAMYAAKRFGGNHFCFFEPEGEHNALANLGQDLWRALERQELHVLYQPQVTATGQLRGCEALLRWQHPTLGEVSPLTFIPIAEANGAILSLGDWVLDTACHQLRQWQQVGLTHMTLSVNVSSRQLRDPDFAQRVCQTLLRTGVAPGALELEITESEAMQSSADGQQRLAPLRALGVKIAVDDFGTGYSNLSRLQTMPVDRLKIDQSFVRDLAASANARAISQCFVSMGTAMGMEVIAEGVETPEQHQVLLDQGCHLIQGYFTGRPMTGEALAAKFNQAP